MGIFLLAPLSFAHSLEFPVDEEIETLEVIEITGTVLEKEPRNLHFPIPEIRAAPQVRLTEYLTLPKLKLVKPLTTPSRIILDRTAKTINLHTPVKPLKIERPVYPRRAREQGWQGRSHPLCQHFRQCDAHGQVNSESLATAEHLIAAWPKLVADQDLQRFPWVSLARGPFPLGLQFHIHAVIGHAAQ